MSLLSSRGRDGRPGRDPLQGASSAPAQGEREGVRELWLVDPPARSVIVLRRGPGSAVFDETREVDGDGVLTSPNLPGLEIPVAGLFA